MTETTTTAAFAALSPAEPDVPALLEASEGLVRRIAAANSVDEVVAIVREWDATRSEVATFASWVGLRFQQDTRDAERQQAREHWDQVRPRWTEATVRVQRALLDHPLRAELEPAIGSQAFALWESATLAFDPQIVDALAEESQLESEYVALLAGAEIEFDGEVETLSRITRHRQSAKREDRHRSERALWGWFTDNRPTLDRIFDDLVGLRTRIARELGARNFVEVGYQRMSRVDYGPQDVERFRASIVNEVVPLAAELEVRRAKSLGVERVMAWDEYVHGPEGNPAPRGDRPWMVARANEMFRQLDPALADFFGRLDGGGYLDLDARPGKAGGGFCTSFPTVGMPFVFANFNGTKDDVVVLTHEIGHAFQNYASRDLFPSDLRWPTYESAEVHSMSLEFLTWPEMDRFFGPEEAARYRRVHLTDSLTFLAYGTAVDHFQHEVYGNPDWTPDERHACWRRMEQTYLPWRDWGDLEHPGRGGRWQHQRHIYTRPFYYIDYVLAQTCALQFWARAEADREEAMRAYVELCSRGGSLPFQSLVRSAGLVSPFDEGCLTDAVTRAREVL
ncbi:MAG: M3 family oligoendopeptidase [Planctomycetota bacterium]